MYREGVYGYVHGCIHRSTALRLMLPCFLKALLSTFENNVSEDVSRFYRSALARGAFLIEHGYRKALWQPLRAVSHVKRKTRKSMKRRKSIKLEEDIKL